MRLDVLLRRSVKDISSCAISVDDVELDNYEELVGGGYFTLILNKALHALKSQHYDVFVLMMYILEVAGLGGGSAGLEGSSRESLGSNGESKTASVTATNNRIHSASHDHIDRGASLSYLFKALATPANVAALHFQKKFGNSATSRIGNSFAASHNNNSLNNNNNNMNQPSPTSCDAILNVADVLQYFIDAIGMLHEVAYAVEEGIVMIAKGETIHATRGIGDYMLLTSLNGSAQPLTSLSIRQGEIQHVLESVVGPVGGASCISHPVALLEALGLFIHTVVLPLCLCAPPLSPSSSVRGGLNKKENVANAAIFATTQHVSLVKESLGNDVMPLMFNLIELLQLLSRSRTSCGLIKLCGKGTAGGQESSVLRVCREVLAALMGFSIDVKQDDRAVLPPSFSTPLSEMPSPLTLVLSNARDCAASIIMLLKGSKENKKRLYTFVDSSLQFCQMREGYESESDADDDDIQATNITIDGVSPRRKFRTALKESFVDYQKDSATLLGRLLLPHPPLLCSMRLMRAAVGKLEGSRSNARATSHSTRQQRPLSETATDALAKTLLMRASPSSCVFSAPLLTACQDTYLQLQLCEIAVRARMFKVDAFQRLVTYRRFDAKVVQDEIRDLVMKKENNPQGQPNRSSSRTTTSTRQGVDEISLATHTTAPVNEDPFQRKRNGDGSHDAERPNAVDDDSLFQFSTGPLVFYNQLDMLLSQLPVADASLLFNRMKDMLRDLNEFTVSGIGCSAVAAIVPPIHVADIVNVGGFKQGNERSARCEAKGALLPALLASHFEQVAAGENALEADGSTSPYTALSYPPNAISAFESLRIDACFTTSDPSGVPNGASHRSAAQNSTAPFPLFEGQPTMVHFASSFMVLEVPFGAGSKSVESITIPYDTVRSVRLSRDKTVFVFRLDGGLRLWASEERLRKRQSAVAAANKRNSGGKRGGSLGAHGEEADDLNLENSFAAGVFDDEYSHVFNLGGTGGDDDEELNDGAQHADENNFSPCDAEDSPLTQLGRIPLSLQKEVIESAYSATDSLASLRQLLAPSIVPPNQSSAALPDITLRIVITKATMSGIMGVGVHTRILRLRESYGAAVAKGVIPPRVLKGAANSPLSLQKSARHEDDAENGDTKRHRSEQRFPPKHQPLTRVVEQPLEMVFADRSLSEGNALSHPLHVSSVQVANAVDQHDGEHQEAAIREKQQHHALEDDETAKKKHVLEMVASVLDEQSATRQRHRRLAILSAHKQKIQAYVDAYRSESRELEDAYAKAVRSDISNLKARQKEFNAHVRTAVGELNEGVGILRGVEDTLKQKLSSIEDRFEGLVFTKHIKDSEMSALIDIRTIVDASVRSMEGFLRDHISGSNPIKILEAFVEKQQHKHEKTR